MVLSLLEKYYESDWDLLLSCLKSVAFFGFFRAAPMADGGSQARSQIGAVAAGLHHSHSNARSLTHWARPGIKPPSSHGY